MRKESGFTLMEMGISIFILLTVLGFAAPAILSMSAAYNLHSAAREVATDMANAKLLAIKENTTFRVDFTSGSYQVVRVADNSVFKTRNLADCSVGTTDGSITFHSRGTSSSGSIILSNNFGSRSVNVTLLGRGRIS